MKYQEESYQDIVFDIKEILPQHYTETQLYSDKIQLDPAYDIYELLYLQGVARFFTCRDDDKLIAYIIVMVMMDSHSQGTLKATTDMIYVSPDHRHTTVAEELIQTAVDALEEDGVSVMLINFKSHNPCQSLMDKLEFDRVEVVYSKYLQG